MCDNKTNHIDQYLNTAKTINDYETAADLIKKVIESPIVHSFSELLELPFFQSVIFNLKKKPLKIIFSKMKNNETYSKYYKLLELFSYGTYSDYIGKNKNNLNFLRFYFFFI